MTTENKTIKKLVRTIVSTNPAAYARDMFNFTEESGKLFIPRFDEVSTEQWVEEYEMNWELKDCLDVVCEFYKLVDHLELIAKKCEKLDANPEAIKDQLNNGTLFSTWEKYLSEFKAESMDESVVAAIRKVIENQAGGPEPTVDEVIAYQSNYETYLEAVTNEANARLEENAGIPWAAYDVIIRAIRVAKLMKMGVSSVAIKSEECLLMDAIVIHKYAKSSKAWLASSFEID